MIELFQVGDFISHAGNKLPWKIECDAISEAGWQSLARMIMDDQKEPFYKAVGIPRGGVPLEEALNKYASGNEADKLLVCDDVYTTGTSIRDFCNTIETINAYKWVVFARKPIVSYSSYHVASNVQALFTMPAI